MKKLLLLLILTFLSNLSFANFVDTRWKVSSYVGETWFSKPEDIIGKHQEFYKGWAEGVFYSCNYAGQSMTYNVYSPGEFLGNKEFSLFGETQVELNEDSVYVHRITCNGNKVNDRKVLYPFVTQNNSNKAYYLFEGAVFTLVDDALDKELLEDSLNTAKVDWINSIASKVKSHWRWFDVEDDWSCVVFLQLDRDRGVINYRVRDCNINDSNKERSFIHSIGRAVLKARPLPKAPSDDVFDEFIVFEFTVS